MSSGPHTNSNNVLNMASPVHDSANIVASNSCIGVRDVTLGSGMLANNSSMLTPSILLNGNPLSTESLSGEVIVSQGSVVDRMRPAVSDNASVVCGMSAMSSVGSARSQPAHDAIVQGGSGMVAKKTPR